MSVFAEKLGKIEDSLSRKQLYNIMYDMLKTQDLSGAQLVNICKQNLVEETEPDVIADLLGGRNSIVQGTIKAYIPLEVFEKYNHDIFEMLLAMLAKDSIKDKSTLQSEAARQNFMLAPLFSTNVCRRLTVSLQRLSTS